VSALETAIKFMQFSISQWVSDRLQRLGDVTLFVVDTIRAIFSKRMEWSSAVYQLYFLGFKSQSVVLVTGAFTGMVLCAQTYFQFHKVKMDTATGAVVSVAMWRRAMRALDVGVEAATSAGCQVPLNARIEMVGLVGSLYREPELRARFSPEDTLAAFRWAEAFCRNPWSEDDVSNPVQTIGMPPVQKAALALLPCLAPEHAPDLWPEYVRCIVRLLRPEHVLAQWREQEAAGLMIHGDGDESCGPKTGGGTMGENHHLQKPAMPPQGLGGTPGPLGTGTSSVSHMPAKQAQYRYALNSSFLEKVRSYILCIYTESCFAKRNVLSSVIAYIIIRCRFSISWCLRITVRPS